MKISVYDKILALDDDDTLEEIAAHTHMSVSDLKRYVFDLIKKKENY